MSKSVALIVTIALLAIGCDKDGAIVKSDGGSDQTLIISHDPNKTGSTGVDLPPYDSMLYVLYQTVDMNFDHTSNYFTELRHNLHTNVNGRNLRKYLDYGTLTVGGLAADRFHDYYVVDVPDSGGIPAHKDTVDITTYQGSASNAIPFDPSSGQLVVSGSNSTHIQNFTTNISIPTKLNFTNVTLNQMIHDDQDLHLQLNRVSPIGYVGFIPKNINSSDSTASGFAYAFFDYTVPTDEIVISKQQLELLTSKWNKDEIDYELFIIEENIIGPLNTVDKTTGEIYGLPVEVDYTHNVLVKLKKQ